MIQGAKELLEDYYQCPLDQIKYQTKKSQQALGLIDKYFPESGQNGAQVINPEVDVN
jgi:hypothetical protein